MMIFYFSFIWYNTIHWFLDQDGEQERLLEQKRQAQAAIEEAAPEQLGRILEALGAGRISRAAASWPRMQKRPSSSSVWGGAGSWERCPATRLSLSGFDTI